MKKYNICLLLIAFFVAVTACSDDRDSNPTLQIPASFLLNTPGYATGIYDLKNAGTIELTTTQPDYGFTAATTYKVQVSAENNFEDETKYITLSSAFTAAKMDVPAQEVAMAMMTLLDISTEEDVPTDPIPVYFRLQATLNSGMYPTYSNVIELPKVLAYFALSEVTLPENMYVIGSINDWNWDNAFSMVPVHSAPGKFWRVVYFPDNAEIKFNINTSWDGNDFGYVADYFSSSAISYAGLEESGGNIKVKKGGWYIVVVSTALEGRAYNYTIDFLAPDVYLTGNTSGGWDSFTDANKFTVPEGEGEFVSPTFVASDELRMCVKLADTDWWKTEFVILGGNIVYRGAGEDQERVQVAAGQKAYLDFTNGKGSVK
ncbi:SusF/SusE family outer membrane protein [Parabacteroides sp. OttesenSCG-928-G06]|nr:SusF/SusE family outer membrane protein [Parabacteroides sp. OttesenSCG-928-K15]MDL2281953.1 SusF/SusE family outer membrane protein [Parabacteroides sp. OttesenSCG-928-G06]